jgi:hypothetical protein
MSHPFPIPGSLLATLPFSDFVSTGAVSGPLHTHLLSNRLLFKPLLIDHYLFW